MAAESLPTPVQQANRTFSAKSFRMIANYTRKRSSRRWIPILAWQLVCIMIALVATTSVEGPGEPDPNPRWGGFKKRPMDEQCYKQERIATLLAFFLGCLGIDQFYAHHWLLAVFKLLSLGGLGTWWLVDMVLWIIGGQYGTPGCPGGARSGLEWLH